MISNNGVHTWKSISLGGKRGTISGVMKMNKDGLAWRSKSGQSVSVVGSELVEASWIPISSVFQLSLKTKGGTVYKFDGFTSQDETFLKNFYKENFDIEIYDIELSTKGWNWGEFKVKDGYLSFFVEQEKAFDIPLSEVASAAATGKSNEVALDFHQDTKTDGNVESLVKMNLYFPKQEESNSNAGKEQVQKFITRILSKAEQVSSGKAVATFKDVPILTPRGNYEIEMYASFMKMNGKTYKYKIKYSNIVRLFQLPKPDDRHQMFVVSLEPPVRQGHVAYPHIVMKLSETEELELKTFIPKELENDERMKQLHTSLGSGPRPLHDLVPRVFKILSGKHVTAPKSFKSKEGASAIKCSLRAYEGYLFPLERSFFFVHKPPTYIRFDEISGVEFLRVVNESTNRTFDLGFKLNNGSSVQFKSLVRDEYVPLSRFFAKKKIPIINADGTSQVAEIEGVSDNESKEEEGSADGATGGGGGGAGTGSTTGGVEKKKRSARAITKEARLKVQQAMHKEKIDSDESDQDFGFNAENPEEEDIVESGEAESDVGEQDKKASTSNNNNAPAAAGAAGGGAAVAAAGAGGRTKEKGGAPKSDTVSGDKKRKRSDDGSSNATDQ